MTPAEVFGRFDYCQMIVPQARKMLGRPLPAARVPPARSPRALLTACDVPV